jgi:putative transposase
MRVRPRDSVRGYIASQEAHHKTRTYREELIEMLTKAGIEYDTEYLD